MSNDLKDAINRFKESNNDNEKVIPNGLPREETYGQYKETDPDLIVGYELLTLPSKGINKYGGNFSIDQLKVEYLTSQDEDILTTPSLIESGRVLDVLLKRKIRENIDVEKMYSGDKNAITLFLRTSSYGYEYDVEVYDPRTGIPFNTTVDLSKLKYKKITTLPNEMGLYSVEIPIRKKIIQFRLLNSQEEKILLQQSEAQREAYNEEVSTYNSLKLKSHIVSVDGNTSRDYINKFVDALPLKDGLEIRKKILEVSPDVDMSYEFITKDGYKFKAKLSIGVDFFFPSL